MIAGLLGAATLVLVVAVVLLFRMDMRPRIENLVSARLGRALTIETISVGWGSPLTLDLTGLRLANPAWGSTPDMVTIARLRGEIALWPLLRGRIDLSQLMVDRPVVVLERDTDGTGNWVFPGLGARPSGGANKLAPPPVRFVSDMQLSEGYLTFRTTKHNLLRVNVAEAKLQAANDTAPVILHVEGAYNDVPLIADVILESFAALHQVPRPVVTEATVMAKNKTVNFKGAMSDPIGFDGVAGEINLTAGMSAEESDAFEMPGVVDVKLSLKGKLDKQGDRWRVTDINGVFAGSPVVGTLGLDEGKRGQPDHFDVDLNFESLDLQRLTAGNSDAPPPGPTGRRVFR